MNFTIREMDLRDKDSVFDMMRTFYASPAVYTNGSDEIFLKDIENCIGGNPYVEGYVFENEKGIFGYSMIAKSYSTEFGKPCIWIEDIYVKDEFRGQGAGKAFFDHITEKYSGCLFRLEVEEENEAAIGLYRKCGFIVLPYMEMKK